MAPWIKLSPCKNEDQRSDPQNPYENRTRWLRGKVESGNPGASRPDLLGSVSSGFRERASFIK